LFLFDLHFNSCRKLFFGFISSMWKRTCRTG
jgi:hypothetical protein